QAPDLVVGQPGGVVSGFGQEAEPGDVVVVRYPHFGSFLGASVTGPGGAPQRTRAGRCVFGAPQGAVRGHAAARLSSFQLGWGEAGRGRGAGTTRPWSQPAWRLAGVWREWLAQCPRGSTVRRSGLRRDERGCAGRGRPAGAGARRSAAASG